MVQWSTIENGHIQQVTGLSFLCPFTWISVSHLVHFGHSSILFYSTGSLLQPFLSATSEHVWFWPCNWTQVLSTLTLHWMAPCEAVLLHEKHTWLKAVKTLQSLLPSRKSGWISTNNNKHKVDREHPQQVSTCNLLGLCIVADWPMWQYMLWEGVPLRFPDTACSCHKPIEFWQWISTNYKWTEHKS